MKRNILSSFFVTFILICSSSGAFSRVHKINASENNNVRVGYYYLTNFQEGASENELKNGYAYEYMQKVAYYTGWNYEYIYDDWDHLYNKLIDGDIDVMAGVSYTDERKDLFLFPDNEMGYENYYIFKHASDDDLTRDNLTSKADIVYGVMENTTVAGALTSWAEKNDISLNIKYFNNYDELITSFQNNECRVIANSENNFTKDISVESLTSIGKTDYYLALNHSRSDLLNELNNAINELNKTEPYFLDNLRYTFYGETSESNILSENEKDWLNNHSTLTIGYFVDYLPYCDEDKNKKATGLLTDVSSEILSHLNISDKLNINYVPYSNYSEILTSLNNNDIDLAFPVRGDSWYAEKNNIYASNALITTSINLIYKGSYSSSTTSIIAVNKHNEMQIDYVKSLYPDAEIKEYSSIEECLSAVVNKKAGSTIINSLRSGILLSSSRYSKLNSMPLSQSDRRCFGIRKGNTELLSLVNHGIRLIGDDYALNAAQKYTANTYTSMDFLIDNAIYISTILVAIIIIIVIVTIAVSKKMKEKNNQLQITGTRLQTQFQIVNALSKEFLDVFLVNPKKGTLRILKQDGFKLQGFTNQSEEIEYSKMFNKYLSERVYIDDKEMMKEVFRIENIMDQLSAKSEYIGSYRVEDNDKIHYYQYKFITLPSSEDIIAGFQNIDFIVLEQNKKQEELQENYNVIEGLADEYFSVLLVDYENNSIKSFHSESGFGNEINTFFSQHSFTWQDLVNKFTSKYVLKEDQELFLRKMSSKTISESKNNYTLSCRIKTKEGEIRYLQIQVSYVQNKDGTKVAIIGTKDINDLVLKEQKQNEKLQDALAEAENANNAKTKFLNSVSHDIRTPMNAIIGFTGLASDHLDDVAATKEYLNKINVSSQYLLSLINDVLDMAKIESGQEKLNITSVYLPRVIHEIRTINHASIEEKHLKVSISAVNVEHEHVFTDELKLNQILLNIVSNAIKFTAVGGNISIKLEELPCEENGFANYRFIIKDNGIGISEEYQKHIFEPFTQEKDSSISGIQGTGLGMAITKNIVDLMGGTISLKSELKKGSEFTVSVKYKIDDSSPLHADQSILGMKVLIVDDNKNNCINVSSSLSKLGLFPEWVTSGKDALEKGKIYDAYIIDFLMPGMNGIELIKALHEKLKDSSPVIILSAYDYSEVEKEGKELGVNGFCSKPLFSSEICDVLVKNKFKNKMQEKEVIIFHNEKILLVEDNILNQEITTEILKRYNLSYEIANNGKEALDMIKKNKAGTYKLVLMDIQMPVMDGYEATHEIRNLIYKAKANIPIIAMSANAFTEDKEKAMNAGMNDYLSKPVNIKELNNILRKYIK